MPAKHEEPRQNAGRAVRDWAGACPGQSSTVGWSGRTREKLVG
jgi:hypothetical protein